MRRLAKDLDLALSMSTQGMSATAIARAIGVHVSTVMRWVPPTERRLKRVGLT